MVGLRQFLTNIIAPHVVQYIGIVILRGHISTACNIHRVSVGSSVTAVKIHVNILP